MKANPELVARILSLFLAIASETPNKFDRRDVEMVEKKNWWVERFVLTTDTEEEALKYIVKCMEWRKSFGVNDLNETSFRQELHDLAIVTTKPSDKDLEGRPIMWINLRAYHINEVTKMIKQFFVYHLERIDKEVSKEGWILIGDTTGARLTNVNMDWILFVISTLQYYYPRGPKYLIAANLPRILRATINAIIKFANKELKGKIKIVSKEKLKQYIDNDNTPDHLRMNMRMNLRSRFG